MEFGKTLGFVLKFVIYRSLCFVVVGNHIDNDPVLREKDLVVVFTIVGLLMQISGPTFPTPNKYFRSTHLEKRLFSCPDV